MGIAIVSTGGTIASTPDAGGDASPELSSTDLVEAVPELADIADLQTHEFANIPSTQFTIEQMFELVAFVHDLSKKPSVDGIVVTQGTDILEETAYFSWLTYDGSAPIIFTGAMRNPSLPSPDGPGNLITAVRTAAHENSQEYGVLVGFNYRLYLPRDVTKAHSMNPHAFRAPEFGPVGSVEEDRVRWERPPQNRTILSPTRDQLTNDVEAITVTADMPTRQFRNAHDASAVCFATTGAGHIPAEIVADLEALAGREVPLIATTRVHAGGLARNTYGFRGSERTLRKLGSYFSDRNLQKTRIKTIVALASDSLESAFVRPE